MIIFFDLDRNRYSERRHTASIFQIYITHLDPDIPGIVGQSDHMPRDYSS